MAVRRGEGAQVLDSFAYREVRTPILEYTPLFVRSVGEVTDVVEKQMYTFDDRDGRSVSMRPEGTAPRCARSSGGAQWNARAGHPLVLHRADVPARARAARTAAPVPSGRRRAVRRRRAHRRRRDDRHAGDDAHRLRAAGRGSGDDPQLPGRARGAAAYRDALVAFSAAHIDKLDEDSRRRLETNPLRVLDSKSPEVQALVADAPVAPRPPGRRLQRRFERVRAPLTALGVATRSTRAWCAASTTTRRRSSRSR